MIVKLSDNIVSPLGYNSIDNYNNLCTGNSKLKLYEGIWDIPEPFIASLFINEELDYVFNKHIPTNKLLTKFEKIVILSAYQAIKEADIDASSDRVIFIISSTKGNIELLNTSDNRIGNNRLLLGTSAKIVSEFFGNKNNPIVVSNACISGACAQLLALRLLKTDLYDYAIVIGADVQSKFIVSGFQSFKALSMNCCKPFDKDRDGLNVGEGAGTIIFKKEKDNNISNKDWILDNGAINNDANHISGPSRTGEGSYRALKKVIADTDIDKIAMINVHGTATLYNDEMESIAISRAGLSNIPINGLKGYYGHTMGAAGIIETILSQYSLNNNIILPTRGYSELGVSNKLIISNKTIETKKREFIKLLSGFGGCNIALLYKQGGTIC